MLSHYSNKSRDKLTTIAQGTNSNYPTASQQVITNTTAWVNLWQHHSSEPIPEVDFTQEQVVAVFAGKNLSASCSFYSLNIISISTINSPSIITVSYYYSENIMRLPTANPYHIVKFPRTMREKIDSERVD